jgi:hypothetical protein
LQQRFFLIGSQLKFVKKQNHFAAPTPKTANHNGKKGRQKAKENGEEGRNSGKQWQWPSSSRDWGQQCLSDLGTLACRPQLLLWLLLTRKLAKPNEKGQAKREVEAKAGIFPLGPFSTHLFFSLHSTLFFFLRFWLKDCDDNKRRTSADSKR